LNRTIRGRRPLGAMKQGLQITLITYLAYCIDKELWKAIDYVKEQVGVLQEQQEKDKRTLLNDHQRIRLAAKAKRLTQRLLEQTGVLFAPDTILSWYRKLIAHTPGGARNATTRGDPQYTNRSRNLYCNSSGKTRTGASRKSGTTWFTSEAREARSGPLSWRSLRSYSLHVLFSSV